MMTSKGIVVYGFPCVGKTTLCKKYANCIDLESSDFQYIKNNTLTSEQSKGLKNRTINPNWPENYFEAIMQSIQNYDFVFVAHQGIIECKKHNVPYWRVYPNISCKNEYIERMKNRGNNECFISKFLKILKVLLRAVNQIWIVLD